MTMGARIEGIDAPADYNPDSQIDEKDESDSKNKSPGSGDQDKEIDEAIVVIVLLLIILIAVFVYLLYVLKRNKNRGQISFAKTQPPPDLEHHNQKLLGVNNEDTFKTGGGSKVYKSFNNSSNINPQPSIN